MAEDTATKPAELPKPTSWLQWLIVYPALGTSLFAAVPTVWNEVKAWRLGVQASQLQLVEEQQRLWERNLPCIQERGSYEVDGPQGIVVRVTLCETGDALLRYHLSAWPPIYRWVALPVEKVKKP
jgi:hypothetical protein